MFFCPCQQLSNIFVLFCKCLLTSVCVELCVSLSMPPCCLYHLCLPTEDSSDEENTPVLNRFTRKLMLMGFFNVFFLCLGSFFLIKVVLNKYFLFYNFLSFFCQMYVVNRQQSVKVIKKSSSFKHKGNSHCCAYYRAKTQRPWALFLLV